VDHRLTRRTAQQTQRIDAKVSKQVIGQLRKNAAHGVVTLQTGFELILLDAHLAHHVLDDALVLATQFGEFGDLLAQTGES
jgi:hypothetical protein